MNHDEVVSQYKNSSMNEFEVIADLKKRKETPIDCIKVVRNLYNIDLGEAKRRVLNHPDWFKEANTNKEIASSCIGLFEKTQTLNVHNKA